MLQFVDVVVDRDDASQSGISKPGGSQAQPSVANVLDRIARNQDVRPAIALDPLFGGARRVRCYAAVDPIVQDLVMQPPQVPYLVCMKVPRPKNLDVLHNAVELGVPL